MWALVHWNCNFFFHSSFSAALWRRDLPSQKKTGRLWARRSDWPIRTSHACRWRRGIENDIRLWVLHLCLFPFTFWLRSPPQDELATTKRSYEDQLSMMSDHLCSMNETLSKQREEIDTLKLGSKVKNGKSKKRLFFFEGMQTIDELITRLLVNLND